MYLARLPHERVPPCDVVRELGEAAVLELAPRVVPVLLGVGEPGAGVEAAVDDLGLELLRQSPVATRVVLLAPH